MTLSRLHAALLPALGAAALTCTPALAAINDFPTLDRVTYVDQCIGQFDRPRQELLYKCSCAIDKIAEEIDHDTWVGLETFNNAAPIAGERGAYLRDRKDIRTQVKTYRAVQAKARAACFLPEDAQD